MAAELQGTTWCSCHIYLYNWTERLVISDIDGTITKSDVLGHVIPAIGGQWAHAGVAELFTRIKENGYLWDSCCLFSANSVWKLPEMPKLIFFLVFLLGRKVLCIS